MIPSDREQTRALRVEHAPDAVQGCLAREKTPTPLGIP